MNDPDKVIQGTVYQAGQELGLRGKRIQHPEGEIGDLNIKKKASQFGMLGSTYQGTGHPCQLLCDSERAT